MHPKTKRKGKLFFPLMIVSYIYNATFIIIKEVKKKKAKKFEGYLIFYVLSLA